MELWVKYSSEQNCFSVCHKLLVHSMMLFVLCALVFPDVLLCFLMWFFSHNIFHCWRWFFFVALDFFFFFVILLPWHKVVILTLVMAALSEAEHRAALLITSGGRHQRTSVLASVGRRAVEVCDGHAYKAVLNDFVLHYVKHRCNYNYFPFVSYTFLLHNNVW